MHRVQRAGYKASVLYRTQTPKIPWILNQTTIGFEWQLLVLILVISCFLLQRVAYIKSRMAGAGSSMLYSFLLFIATLSLQEIYRAKLASSELFTILGGFTSSLIFLLLLTFIGNYQETCGVRTGWGTVIIAEAVALIAASTVHRVCITTCFLFSALLLYEVNKLSGILLSKSEPWVKRF